MQVQVLALPEPSGEDAFPRLNATIMALASDYASAAGGNQNIAVFDELWAFTSERSRRLWDELVPPPTRQVACRLTTTYAGFEGESLLLEELHKRGLQRRRSATISMLATVFSRSGHTRRLRPGRRRHGWRRCAARCGLISICA